jgi:hypothetical protein
MVKGMTAITVETFIRMPEGFVRASEVRVYEGDPDYVGGALSVMIDDVELFGIEASDHVNWLWAFVIQALEKCRIEGSGKRAFPNRPLTFAADTVRGSKVLLTVKGSSVTGAPEIDRFVEAPMRETQRALATAGLQFFDNLVRLCPNARFGTAERAILLNWLGRTEDYRAGSWERND